MLYSQNMKENYSQEEPVPFDLINTSTTKEQLKALISANITPEERKYLGDQAESLVAMAIIASMAFAFGGDFDSEAFAAVVDDDLAAYLAEVPIKAGAGEYFETFDTHVDPDRINAILEIVKRVGLIEINEKGRLFYNPKILEISDVIEQLVEGL